MLSNTLVNDLGGKEHLERKLAKGVTVAQRPTGVVLRAGRSPELGDVNRGEKTPLLTSVAHAIEPITYFDDPALENLFSTPERARQWERRFWSDE